MEGAPSFEGSQEAQEVTNEEEVLPSRLEDLPSLKEGYVRLVHLTSPGAAEQIAHSGLGYGERGMISATAEAFSSEMINIETTDSRFNGATSAVIIDMPFELHKLHNNPTEAPGVIPPEYIVGIIARSGSEPHIFKKKKGVPDLNVQREDSGTTGYGPKASSSDTTPVEIPSSSRPGGSIEDVW